MPSIITASTASNTALNLSADTSGVLEIRTGSSPTTALTIDASQNATFANVINGNGSGITSINAANVSSGVLAQARGGTGTTTGYYGFKNRIINGAMTIDQRNAGASVTQTSNFLYTVDRWGIFGDQNSKFTAQQNAGSVTPPAGFTNYLGITSSSAYSVPSGEAYTLQQRIEGFNISDLGWGTANAQTVTLSFWVRSSLTGTFGGSLTNSAFNRSYPYSFTISSANTWEQKTITIAGDTSGTWVTNNGIGIRVYFSLGSGSTLSGTAGAWTGSGLTSATGATSVVGTNGATLYITGVQLEVGSTATSFDYRPYGTELALCQRYAVVYNTRDSNNSNRMGFGMATTTTTSGAMIKHPVTMRSKTSLSSSGTTALSDTTVAFNTTSLAVQSVTSDENQTIVLITVASGLTQFRPYFFEFAGSGTLTLSAEL